jgi:DNA helicase-2/ATP-dependent DNA helicase PcrA
MFVAMTRARDHLAVTYTLIAYSTRRGSDYTIDQLSRFIDPGIRDTMQRVVPKFEEPAKVAPEPVAPLDLRELMKRRFGTT